MEGQAIPKQFTKSRTMFGDPPLTMLNLVSLVWLAQIG